MMKVMMRNMGMVPNMWRGGGGGNAGGMSQAQMMQMYMMSQMGGWQGMSGMGGYGSMNGAGQTSQSQSVNRHLNNAFERGPCFGEVRVQKKLMGRLIGKGGSTINSIREKSQARINAEDVDDNHCELKLSGTLEAVNKARELINAVLEKVKKEKARDPLRDTPKELPEAQGLAAEEGLEAVATAGGKEAEPGEKGGAEGVGKESSGAEGKEESEEKREDVEGQDKDGRDLEEDNGEPKVTEHLTFPASVTGGIIGVKGAKVKEARQQSGAHIEVEKAGDECKVKITGTAAQVESAKTLVNAIAETAEEVAQATGEDVINDTMDFPLSATGAIIGSRGTRIAVVRQRSGAQVSIDKSSDSKRCRVLLSGTVEQIEAAKELVNELVAEASTAAPVRPRENEQVVEVPHSMIGKVIGKGGDTIKRLQRETGAKIDVISDGSDPCPVRVSGSPQAIAAARYMIDAISASGPSGTRAMPPRVTPQEFIAPELKEIDLDEL